jgi:glycosyltransferase involved in cell wall biosynthesis
MNLVVEKYFLNYPKLIDDCQVLTFNEFKKIIKSPKFFVLFFKYDNVKFHIYSINSETNLFFTFLLMRLLGKKKLFYSDKRSTEIVVTFKIISKLGIRYLTNYFQKYYLLFRINQEIDNLLVQKKKILRASLNPTNRALYLRTDLWFGVKSGGSVGHIAGVLNNLSNHFLKEPIFFTTDKIPTVNDLIEQNQLILPNDYWDFSELPTIASNFSFKNSFGEVKLDEISVIYQRYSINNYLGVEIAQKLSIPLIIEYNGSEVWISKNWGRPLKYENLSKKIELLVLKKADLIVVVSSPIKNDLVKLGINSDKILVNPNGVDPDIYTPTLDSSQLKEHLYIENKVILGFIGTFGPWHGAEILAEAFCLLIKQNPELKNSIHLLMIGDGVRRSEVKGIINKSNLESNVTFTGIIPQTDGPLYLSSCDILVSPHVPNVDGTPFFGSPTKLFEYMSMAKGIVASDLDQIGEILKHNETAILVEPGNVHELAQGMKRLILDSNMRKKIGDNARKEIVDSYSWRIHTKKIFDRLSELD